MVGRNAPANGVQGAEALQRSTPRGVKTLAKENATLRRLGGLFATTLIVVVSKAVIFGSRIFSGELDKIGFRNHRKKYAHAVFETLPVNARISRMNVDHEDKFATLFRDGELFNIRNSVLYIKLGPDGAIVVPEQAVDKRNAYLLVCFGGEVLADM